MAKIPEIIVLDRAGKANIDAAISIYRQASGVAKKLGCDVSEVFDAIGYNPAEHIKAVAKYSVPQLHRYLGAVSEKIGQIDRGVPILGPGASEEDIEAVYKALKDGKKGIEKDLLVSQDMLSEEFATEKSSEAEKLLKIISTGNLAIVDDIEKDAKENVKTGKGKTALYVTIAALIAAGVGLSGCLTSADTAAKEKATEKTTTQQYSGAPSPAGTPADAAQSGVNVPWLKEKTGIMGGKYYEIDRAKLPVEANGWKAVFENNKFNDNVIDPDDGVAEMAGGILGDNAIIVVDEDVFKQYGGDFGLKPEDENGFGVRKADVKEIAPGVYYYAPDLNDIGNGFDAHAPFPLSSEELQIRKEHGGAPYISVMRS